MAGDMQSLEGAVARSDCRYWSLLVLPPVTARPCERWGQEVVAVVALEDGVDIGEEALISHAATSPARYKLPKAVVFRPAIQRSPAGKADYRWAREQAGVET
jgi:fatty-acyl-CoA synthase